MQVVSLNKLQSSGSKEPQLEELHFDRCHAIFTALDSRMENQVLSFVGIEIERFVWITLSVLEEIPRAMQYVPNPSR